MHYPAVVCGLSEGAERVEVDKVVYLARVLQFHEMSLHLAIEIDLTDSQARRDEEEEEEEEGRGGEGGMCKEE